MGQPWRARLRYSSAWKDDGGEVGQVTSPDGEKTVRFSVVNPNDERHRMYLKRPQTGGPGPDDDVYQFEEDRLGAPPEENGDTTAAGFLRGRP